MWKLYMLKHRRTSGKKKYSYMISSNNSVNNGFFQQLIILYIDHFRYSSVACNGCLFWLLRTENHPVMVEEHFIHSWGSLKTLLLCLCPFKSEWKRVTLLFYQYDRMSLLTTSSSNGWTTAMKSCICHTHFPIFGKSRNLSWERQRRKALRKVKNKNRNQKNNAGVPLRAKTR